MTRDPIRTSLLNTAFRMALGMSVVMAPAIRADILRGGNQNPAQPPAGGIPSGGAPPAATEQARTNAHDILARTTQALNSVRAMQEAARAAGAGANNAGLHPHTGQPLPDVPNGLAPGGLQVDPRVATDPNWWTGANAPTQTTDGGKTEVTIKQTAQQALLHWETFNIGRDTTLTFDQSAAAGNASQWIAFNKITDPAGNPTQILGQIKADGQVYILNQNGIIFGSNSQINVHTLTASSLPINDNLIASGLLNNPDQQFLFDGLGKGDIGDVTVRAGARISTPVSADGNGGRIFLAGANVTNEGTLTSPAGQVILAAGLQIGVAAHDNADPSLRGLDIYIGAVVDPASALDPYAGTATNSGIIEIARASAILTGKNVHQLGVIDSTTSVALNGRIDLLANYDAVSNPGFDASNPNTGTPFVYRSSGHVSLGLDSVTRILPETAGDAKTIGTELALRSQINLQGKTIHHAPGSILLAPNADVSIQAGSWAFIASPTLPIADFLPTDGQVYLDTGSIINLAGTTDASASVTQNLIELELRGSELAPAPVQRDGELRGETIVVDLGITGTYEGREWVGTPLADLIGYLGLVERDVAQLTTVGGNLTISAGDSAVIRQGSIIDVSGGWTNFEGGTVATTRVVSNGQIVDISQATPDQIYSGIYTANSQIVHSKWGVTESFFRALAPSGTRYQAGYTQGANAGSVTISAPAIVLDGALLGNTVAGGNQIRNTPTSSALPAAASLTLNFRGRENVSPTYHITYPDPLDIVFADTEQEDVADFALDAAGNPIPLSDERKSKVFLSPSLPADSGFGHLTVNNEIGTILVPVGSDLVTAPGGSISLTASNIDILGNVTAAGGSLSFTALNVSPYDAAILLGRPIPESPPARPGRGIFTLGPGATLSTAGLVTDDRYLFSSGTPAIPDGGNITIEAYTANLLHDSLVDVSGGYAMTANGTGKFGDAGAISILAGKDPDISSAVGGVLTLDGVLRGLSGARGGTLSLQAGGIQIGGSSANPSVFVIDPDFFNQGGFTQFNLTGLGGSNFNAVTVAAGTTVQPVAKTLAVVANPPGGGLLLGDFETIHGRAPEPGERRAVSLSLSAPGVRDAAAGTLLHIGNVLIDENASIRVDPGGSVSATGNTVTVLGSIHAPGGDIRVGGSANSASIFGNLNQALATTYIGANSTLSAAGAVVLRPDPYGRRIGTVFGGGSIHITGNIVAAEGAVLDVSGASGILDFDPAFASVFDPLTVTPLAGLTEVPRVNQSVPVRVDSNAGSITLAGGQFLLSDATLLGNAGGTTATGGSLSVSSGRFYTPAENPSPSDITLSVFQSGPVLASQPASNPIGQAVQGSQGSGRGFFAIDDFQNGGFDSLSLGGILELRGPVAIDARGRVNLADQGILYNQSALSVQAGAVSIGMSFRTPLLPEENVSPILFNNQPFLIPALHGGGTLDIAAGHIDIGYLSLQGTGQATLAADGGDIRGNGTFIIAGDLTLRAAQIYPTTASEFNLIAYDYQNASGAQKGSITIHQSGSRGLPFSAGGKLGIYASAIHHGGTLRAPFGVIHLGWDGSGSAPRDWFTGSSRPFPVTSDLILADGSVTSVSAVDPVTGEGLTLPYGYSPDGTVWIDPRGVDITAGGLPEKEIVLAAANIVQEAGSSIDLRGGGDLYADRWVAGLGGPIDILTSSNSFAIIPAYDAHQAPYAPYNTSTNTNNLIAGAPGYTNASLAIGDRIYLSGSKTLPAGYYTLLPARYALLPGAVLVTPSAAGGYGTLEIPGGASIVSGFRYNSLSDERQLPTLAARFEVASSEVVRTRAQYLDLLANTFIKESAAALNAPTPILPADSGYLRFQATQSMDLLGSVASRSIDGGRGAAIDISTQLDTFISNGLTTGGPGSITLDAAALNAFGAESLLIGGTRTRSGDTSTVEVRSGKITIDNEGSPLSAADLILAAREDLTLAPGAELASTGPVDTPTDTLQLTGDGSLVRVSANPAAPVLRDGVTASATPLLTIGAGARITGGGIVLDSTSALSLDPAAVLTADAYTFGAGHISVLLGETAATPAPGSLILTNGFLQHLQSAGSLDFLSYSSIDLLGSGQFGSAFLANLTLSAGQIRGIDQGDGVARIVARDILLRNPNASSPATPGAATGTLELSAETIRLGSNNISLDQYASVRLAASRGITGEGTGGLITQGALTLDTPRLTGAAGAVRTITSGGALRLTDTFGTTTNLVSGGLGSTLSLTGASLTAESDILLRSGSLSLHAATGDLDVSGHLDVSGTRASFGGTAKYTSAGSIRLSAAVGDVIVAPAATLTLAAHTGGGDAGALSISTPTGSLALQGTLLGQGGNGGQNAGFTLDTHSLPTLAALSEQLRLNHFTGSQDIRVRTGDITLDGLTLARDFTLSADQGSITVTGVVDASGPTGGSIRLAAHGDITLESGSRLTVAGADFSSAGKGGSITLEAGAQRDGIAGPGALDLRGGAVLDLTVAAQNANSASLGQLGGKLHLRAPRIGDDDIALAALDATVTGASSILVEAFKIYDLTGGTGTLTTALQNEIRADGETFLGVSGTASAAATSITTRLLANNSGLADALVLAPGAEILNRDGNLTLGNTTSTNTSDWNLAPFRFGEKSAPGVLTLRASGNLVFHNALSDGFASSAHNALLLNQNPLLPLNAQSWSYRLVSGADLSAADFGRTLALPDLAANVGSLQLGKNNGTNLSNSNGSNNQPGLNATTVAALTNRFQVIRTGSGDIDIHAGRSIQLLNQFATIYTAGTRVADPTLGGNFDVPILDQTGGNITLGANQQSPPYAVQYSLAGGNVSLFAGLDIEHITRNNQNQIIADSQRQLPNNWLYRRGYIDPATGQFTTARFGDTATTTWWIDFSNFFQGIGALGGGDVTLVAGRNINNVDAVVPTNARMPKGAPNASNLIELGGGDLLVRAGNNLDAGVYYIERGHGEISAGGSIVTNSTRSPSVTQVAGSNSVLDSATWLPTTLFVGKGGFDVTSFGDLLLGPVANPFLLPPGINNTFWYKSYFSTYAPDTYVDVSSIGGAVTLRQGATLPAAGAGTVTPLLLAWIDRQQVLRSNPVTASFYQPWLRLAETSAEPFRTTVSLLPPTLLATSFHSDINLAGNLTLFPSATGNIELLAGGSIHGLQRNGRVTVSNAATSSWGASRINLSDANPAAIPGIASPFAYSVLAGNDLTQARSTRANFLEFINRLFRETGATLGPQAVLETKQALHAPGLLHRDDPNPLRLYAGSGDISGLTLFSPKAALIYAGRDIADVAFYIQNLRPSDTSVIVAGRDIIPSNANSLLRLAAASPGNIVNNDSPVLPGDLQISGPGTLQVLAGRNLDLGTGPDFADGTGAGITSIGNARNPFLPTAGANLLVGAGIADATSLADSSLDLPAFIAQYVTTPEGEDYLDELVPGLDLAAFAILSEEEQARLALGVFQLILRDAGRNYPLVGNYDTALDAIAVLFGELGEDELPLPGDILTRGRSIRTARGGAIHLLMPGGGLTLANTAIGNPLSPPGIITESGGDIFTFARENIDIGIGRIFTLRGGNQVIWSTTGDIAAGSSSKTVTSAPPTRVLIDPQSAAVQTDLAGLATGGGIGALATVAGVALGDVDLIAPEGTVDAGDAGIRVSGNLNIAANQVLNAGNIAVGGTSGGAPAAPAAPSVAAVTPPATATPAPGDQAQPAAATTTEDAAPVVEEPDSIITVEIFGYGGSFDEEEEEEQED